MNNQQNLFLNPFQRIAGLKALAFGIAGLIVVTILSTFNFLHFNGIGQVAIRQEGSTFFVFMVEHLIIWIVPVVLFYLTGLFLSTSRIRIVDIFGTILFAQLPYIGVALVGFLPALQAMMSIKEIDINVIQSPEFIRGTLYVLLFIPFFVWSIIWMFQAYKTSCNLKGVKLGASFVIIIVLSDIVSRILIGVFSKSILC